MRIYPQLSKIPGLLTWSPQIKEFIKAYETKHDGDLSTIGLEPKLDGAGIWTEGWGKAMVHNGRFMRVSEYPTLESIMRYRTITNDAEADEALENKLNEIAAGVRKRLRVQVTQYQFDALVSHAYNCGFSDTLYNRINNDAPEERIQEWFTRHFITSGGVRMEGLVLRRYDEYEIWKNINYTREYRRSA